MDFTQFEKNVGVKFNDKNLLRQAFVHRSYINENKDAGFGHNERLEFLGDAVLELVITDYLYKKYPDKNEGDMTSYRSALVNATTCAAVATKLGMNDFLILSKGEAKDTGRARQYILANTLEAVIGAIYILFILTFRPLLITFFPKVRGLIQKASFRKKPRRSSNLHRSIKPSKKPVPTTTSTLPSVFLSAPK
jgi:dsRNA-specific ribonuclease